MYGMLRSSLLFYLKLVEELQAYGFSINPNDPCDANKLVNGTQMIVTLHADDLKFSHKEAHELTQLILYLA